MRLGRDCGDGRTTGRSPGRRRRLAAGEACGSPRRRGGLRPRGSTRQKDKGTVADGEKAPCHRDGLPGKGVGVRAVRQGDCRGAALPRQRENADRTGIGGGVEGGHNAAGIIGGDAELRIGGQRLLWRQAGQDRD